MSRYGLMHDVEQLLQVAGLMVLLHRLLVLKNPHGLSRKSQELLLIAYTIDLTGWDERLFLTAFIVLLLSSWSHHPVRSLYHHRKATDDSFPHWLLLVLAIIAGFIFVVALPDEMWTSLTTRALEKSKNGTTPTKTQKDLIDDVASIVWMKMAADSLKLLALIPQIILFRKNPTEGFHGGVFVLLTGLARPVAVAVTSVLAYGHYQLLLETALLETEARWDALTNTTISIEKADSLLKAEEFTKGFFSTYTFEEF